MRLHLAAGLLAIAAAGGCYAETGVGYSAGYSATYVAPPPPPAPVYQTTATVSVDTYQPDLVDVGGGVQVIADYDEPVFYTDNFYWRFYGGTWYRSSAYNGGWVVYNDVPYSVRRIDRPHTYAHYRPSGYVPRAQRDPYVRDHRAYDNRGYQAPPPGPAVRDHRTYDNRGYQPAPAPGPAVRDHRSEPYQPAPAPVVRDHRTEPPPASSGPIYRSAPPTAAPPPAQRDHRDDRRKTTTRDHRN
jgi:hypothetical protein